MRGLHGVPIWAPRGGSHEGLRGVSCGFAWSDLVNIGVHLNEKPHGLRPPVSCRAHKQRICMPFLSVRNHQTLRARYHQV